MCMTYHYRLICSYNFCLFFYFELKKFSLIYLFNIYVFIWSNIWGLSWRMFHVHLKKNVYSVVERIIGVCCVHLSIVLFKYSISILMFCLVVLYIIESELLKSPTIILDLSTSLSNSNNVCYIQFGGMLFGAYMFIVVTSSWWIDPFINM